MGLGHCFPPSIYKIVSCTALVLMVLALLPASSHGVGPTIKTVSFPSDAVTIGMVYSEMDGHVYAASFTYGVIYRVDLATLTYSTIQLSSGQYNRLYYGLVMDGNGNLWATRRMKGNDGTPPGLSKITLPDGVETFVINGVSGEWDGVGYCNNFIYTAAETTLYKVNPSNDTVSNFPIPASGAFYGFSCDSGGNLWFTDILNGRLYTFNTNNSSLSYVSGFDRPLGVATYSTSVYVAENVRTWGTSPDSGTPAIANYSMQTGTITRITQFARGVAGSPYGVSIVMYNGSPYLLYTSSAEDAGRTAGIGIIDNGFVSLPEAAIYYIASDNAGNVYFSYYGSSGVGSLSGWPSGNPIAKLVQLSLGLVAPPSPPNGGSVVYSPVTLETQVTGPSPVLDASVNIYVNGTKVCSGSSNVNGIYSCTYSPQSKRVYAWYAAASKSGYADGLSQTFTFTTFTFTQPSLSSAASAMLNASEKSVYFIFPDSGHKKPTGVGYAQVTDWTALGFTYGSLTNMPQVIALDTNSAYVDQSTGAPKVTNSTIVLFGGPLVNEVVHYYESNGIAPLHWGLVGGFVSGTEYYSNRLNHPVASIPLSALGPESQDMGLIESFMDPNGNTVIIFSGFGWQGTFVSGLYFKTVLVQQLSTMTDSWYIYSWSDTNGNGFADVSEVNPTPVHGN